MSNSLQPHGLQHARPPCPSPAPGVYLNSCPLSRWTAQWGPGFLAPRLWELEEPLAWYWFCCRSQLCEFSPVDQALLGLKRPSSKDCIARLLCPLPSSYSWPMGGARGDWEAWGERHKRLMSPTPSLLARVVAVAEPPSYGHRSHEAAPLTWLQCPRGSSPQRVGKIAGFCWSLGALPSLLASSLYFPSTWVAGRTT